MNLIWAGLIFCALVTALHIATALTARAISHGQSLYRGRLRAHVEPALYAYAAADGSAPPAPRGRAQRGIVRAVATELLLELDDPEHRRVASLLEAQGLVADAVRQLDSPFAYRRLRAADELALVRSSEAAPALAAALFDSDESVRLQCARALAEVGDARYVDEIVRVVQGATRPGGGEVAAVTLALRERFAQ